MIAASLPCRRAPASASSPSTIARSSTPGPMSASSRCMPRTTWAPAARRTVISRRSRTLSAVAARRRPVDRRRGDLDTAHLRRLRHLVERYRPASFSEHLAWSTHDSAYLNDLLPLPYTEATLERVARHVDEAQQALGRGCCSRTPRPMCCSPRARSRKAISWRAIAARTGCGLLLDVNNVMVSAVNHRLDPVAYIDRFPVEQVGEIHLAGYDETTDGAGDRLLIDAHGSTVKPDVIALYRHTLSRTGPVPTLIEWDNDVPDFDMLLAEAIKRRAHAGRRGTAATGRRRGRPEATWPCRHPAGSPRRCSGASGAGRPHHGARRARPARFAVYRNNVIVGLREALAKRFPVTLRLVGDEFFRGMARASSPAAGRLAAAHPIWRRFPDFIETFEAAQPCPISPMSRARGGLDARLSCRGCRTDRRSVRWPDRRRGLAKRGCRGIHPRP